MAATLKNLTGWLRSAAPPLGRRSLMSVPTFAEKFCAENGIAEKDFVRVALTRSLYPAARLLRPVLALKPGYFAADREFISFVGGITRFSDFDHEAAAFSAHPNNSWLLRQKLKLRVSVRRVHSMARVTFGVSGGGGRSG